MSSNPPLLVPSLLWGGDGSLYKVPYHTFGAAKKRYLRLKPYNNNDNNFSDFIEIALVDNQADSTKKYYVVKAASPLSFIWSDPQSSAGNNTENTGGLLSSPLFKKRLNSDHELLVEDILQIQSGNRTSAFQAFIAKNGIESIPNESCCFSLISNKRSLDFYVQSSLGNIDGMDAKLASDWKDSIQTLLNNFHLKQKNLQHTSLGSSIASSTVRTRQHWDPKLHSNSLFEAAKASDLGTLRWYLDNGCPVDFMDENGDTILIVACRLGLFDVARLALIGYQAHNDPHPDFGQTALQVAVSSGHVSLVKLILDAAEESGADRIIVNHEESERGEAPIHVASRCGSVEIFELLVEHGANLGLIDGRGRTCLHCASQSGEEECLLMALENGADEYIEVLSHEGYTALHTAIRANKTGCVKILLQGGADVSAEAANGSNVYNLASKQRSERIMKLLLDYDVSEGESNYDSYGDEDSSEDDMFRGLNKYNVSPPTNPNYSPYTVSGGSLVSPAIQSSMHLNLSRSPVCTGNNNAPLGRINHSPIVGVNHRLSALNSNVGLSSPQQYHHVRFDTPHFDSEEEVEFYHKGDLWRSYISNDGYPYFYNVDKNTSVWGDPRKQIHTYTPQRAFETPMSLLRHDGQLQSNRPRSASYTKKLTAIPQLKNMSPSTTSKRPLTSPSTPVSSSTTERTAINEKREASFVQACGMSGEIKQPNATLNQPLKRAVMTPTVEHSPGAPDPKGKLLAQVKTSSLTPTKDKPYALLVPSDKEEVDPKNMGNISATPTQDKKTNVPLNNLPSSDSREKPDSRVMLMAHIKARSGVINPTATSQTSATTKTAMENTATDPKSMRPKSREMDTAAVNPESKAISSTTNSISSDPKTMLMAHIKSRAGSTGGSASTHTPKMPSSSTTKMDEETVVEENTCDAKGMLMAHIKARAVQSAEQPSSLPIDKSNAAQIDRITSKEDPVLAKYMKMKSVGVPSDAIVHKMKLEGVDQAKIKLFCLSHMDNQSSAPDPKAKESSEATALSPKRQSKDRLKQALMQDEDCKKFMRMSSVGVPVQAVVHKMESEGMEIAKIDLFKEYHGLTSSATSSTPRGSMPTPTQHKTPREKYEHCTDEDLAKDNTYSKYLNMKKVGVPLMAIVVKMRQDSVDPEKIQIFSVVNGLAKPTSTRNRKTTPMHRGGRRASKALQKIHWNTVAEEKLDGSLWASQENAEDDINDSEIARLEDLFGVSPINKKAGQKKPTIKKNTKMPTTSLIDPKRANNIAISLAQFRAFSSFDDLCQAVATLDGTHLNVEKLTNMMGLLPTPEETNSLKRFNDNEKSGSDGLGRAELFFLSVMKIPRFTQKLEVFQYTLQFDDQVQSLTSSLQALGRACDEVVCSKKLASILRRLLQIGNLMNASTGKPEAKGITLDSLIKTAKKKSNDGRIMVIDLVVSQTLAKNLDVDFWSDMPAVRDATRLDLDDIRLLLRDIQKGSQSVQHSIQAEKAESSPSEQFLAQLEPFLVKANGSIENVKTLFSRVEEKVKSLCSFFAEDQKSCKASTIFCVLLDFSRLVDKSKEQHMRKEQAKRRESRRRPSSAL